MNNSEIQGKLREAINYIESLHDAIDTTMNDSGKDMIYRYQGTQVNFDIGEAKALLAELEKRK